MNNTDIGWTDYTWNPVTGCKHGCEYCYAKKLAETRLSHIYKDGFQPTLWENRLNQPKEVKGGRRIFVVSMGDLFGEWVPNHWIEKVLEIVKDCPQHTFQFLTKNPARYSHFDFPDNTILGTTITNSEQMKELATIETEKIVRNNNTFVSFEPLLEDVLNKHISYPAHFFGDVDWIIIGAKTGKNPIQPKRKWVMKILSTAYYSETPVFIKDNLDWNKIKPNQFPKE